MKNTTKLSIITAAVLCLVSQAEQAFACNAKGGKVCADSVAGKTSKIKSTSSIDQIQPGGVIPLGVVAPINAAPIIAPAPLAGKSGKLTPAPVLYYMKLSSGELVQLPDRALTHQIVNPDGTLTAGASSMGIIRVAGTPTLAPKSATASNPVPTQQVAAAVPQLAPLSAGAPVAYYFQSGPTGNVVPMELNPTKNPNLVNPDGSLTAAGLSMGMHMVVGTALVAPGLAGGPAPVAANIQAPALAAPTLVAPGLVAPTLATTPQSFQYFMTVRGGQVMQINPSTLGRALLNPDGSLTAVAKAAGITSSPIGLVQTGASVPLLQQPSQSNGLPSVAVVTPKHLTAAGSQHTEPHIPVAVYHPTTSATYRYEDAKQIGDVSFHLIVVGVNDGKTEK